jgi:hypothetical protein
LSAFSRTRSTPRHTIRWSMRRWSRMCAPSVALVRGIEHVCLTVRSICMKLARPGNPLVTLVANSYAAFRAAQGAQRVFARGVPATHAPRRTKGSAAAVARGGPWGLASPISRAWRRPHRRIPGAWGRAIPARGAYGRGHAAVVWRGRAACRASYGSRAWRPQRCGSFCALGPGARCRHGVPSWRAKRPSHGLPGVEGGGSQERRGWPMGQGTTVRAPATTHGEVAQPVPARPCQRGASATGPMRGPPDVRGRSPTTGASGEPLATRGSGGSPARGASDVWTGASLFAFGVGAGVVSTWAIQGGVSASQVAVTWTL